MLVLRPRSLRVSWRKLAFLALFGVTGVAFVQWFYFLAIHRLPVGIALLIQYLAPLLVALFAFYVLHEPVRRRILAGARPGAHRARARRAGVGRHQPRQRGRGGVAGRGVRLRAAYILMAEHETARKGRDPASLSFYGFLFCSRVLGRRAALWQFPFDRLDDSVSLLGNLAEREAPVWLLMLFVVVIGTMVTFALITSALRHISATRVGIAAMLEPVAASVVA